jgi:hypothetical protein
MSRPLDEGSPFRLKRFDAGPAFNPCGADLIERRFFNERKWGGER